VARERAPPTKSVSCYSRIRRSAENSHMGRKSALDEEAGSERFGPIRGREMIDAAGQALLQSSVS